VLEPEKHFDAAQDKVFIVSTPEASFLAKRLTLNGTEQPGPAVLNRGVKYRLRVINMGPDLAADFQLGTQENPATWRAIAKDGATLPSQAVKMANAKLHIASGETYDLEFQPQIAGEIPLQVKNIVNSATLAGKIVVK
jgi:FtsP/CotA-like multicopper oxidase with cupredoxin domain